MSVDLTPLPYHLAVASRLESLEPRAWRVFADAVHGRDGLVAQPGPSAPPSAAPPVTTDVADPAPPDAPRPGDDDLDQLLLRHAYRMEASAHPRVHDAARRAAGALGIDVPLAIYQLEGTDRANASLAFRPGEAVLALSGNVLALLTDEELVACFGHELAHHALWSHDGARILVADRFLDALAIDPQTPGVYLETARRFDLATELFADRGSLRAAGSLDVTVAALVKVATGLGDVDPHSFLRQAESARPDRGAHGTTHPETVLRAWALARCQAGDGDEAAATLLAPSLDIERLDLVDRERLETVTRRLVLDVLSADWMRTDAVVGHARHFMVDAVPAANRGRRWRDALRDGPSVNAPVETRIPDPTPAETKRYFAYVLLDLATVDPELDDEPLVEALAVAREAGIGDVFAEVAKRELTLNARTLENLRRRSAERRVARPAPAGTGLSDATGSTERPERGS